jgi:Putative Zn-dependent protease, contains TPR repeats
MTQRNAYVFATALALLCASPAMAVAANPSGRGIDHNREFQACMTLAEQKPAEAFESALTWQDRGGGDLARLCQAMALFHKGDFKAAGARLEELVPILGKDDPKAAASLLGRAGWAWLRAGDETRAERAYTQALQQQPNDVDLYIDRAFARGEAERYWDAIADLDTALAKDPKRADAYLYRAGANKALANDRQAIADIDRALQLKPNDPDAVLLRGNIKAQIGNIAGAKEDWQLVQRLAPDASAGRTAQVNLDRAAKMEAAKPKPGKLPESKGSGDKTPKP